MTYNNLKNLLKRSNSQSLSPLNLISLIWNTEHHLFSELTELG